MGKKACTMLLPLRINGSTRPLFKSCLSAVCYLAQSNVLFYYLILDMQMISQSKGLVLAIDVDGTSVYGYTNKLPIYNHHILQILVWARNISLFTCLCYLSRTFIVRRVTMGKPMNPSLVFNIRNNFQQLLYVPLFLNSYSPPKKNTCYNFIH